MLIDAHVVRRLEEEAALAIRYLFKVFKRLHRHLLDLVAGRAEEVVVLAAAAGDHCALLTRHMGAERRSGRDVGEARLYLGRAGRQRNNRVSGGH